MRIKAPLLGGLLRKLVLDVMPKTAASAIAAILLTHYGLDRAAEPVAAQVAPAPPEMMQLLRDEHGLIANYVDAQVANEKRQLAAEDAEPRVPVVEPPLATTPAAAAPPAPRQAVVAIAAKSAPPRSKASPAGIAPQPLAIAPLPPPVEVANEAADPPAQNSDSLLAKTIGIKDHVVAVTHSVVSAIGGIPSWFGSIGDRIGGDNPSPRPRADVVDAS
jgi:hypothetical protein